MHKVGLFLLALTVYMSTMWAGGNLVDSYVSEDSDACNQAVINARHFIGEAEEGSVLSVTDCVEVNLGGSDHDMSPERQSP